MYKLETLIFLNYNTDFNVCNLDILYLTFLHAL